MSGGPTKTLEWISVDPVRILEHVCVQQPEISALLIHPLITVNILLVLVQKLNLNICTSSLTDTYKVIVIAYNTTGTCQPFNIVQYMIKDKVVWLTCGHWYLLCMLSVLVLCFSKHCSLIWISLNFYLFFWTFLQMKLNVSIFHFKWSFSLCQFYFHHYSKKIGFELFCVLHIRWHYCLQWFCFLSSFAGALLGLMNCFGCWYHGTLWKDPHRLFSCCNSRTDSLILWFLTPLLTDVSSFHYICRI